MQDRSRQVLIVNIVFMTLTTAVVGLRIYCRGWIVRALGIDDKLMLATWVLFMAFLTAQLLCITHGTGKHRKVLTVMDNTDALIWYFVGELLYIACTSLLKISVGFFLLRISADLRHIWIIRTPMILTAVFGLTYFFISVFQCSPVSAFWEHSPRAPGYCISEGFVLVITYTASSLNCLADWVFGVLPVFFVWTLKMPFRTRVMVSVILSFAAVGSSATIVRATFVPSLLNKDDYLYATVDIATWSAIELGVGISAASMATLKPLVELLSYKVGLSSTGPSNSNWQDYHRGRHAQSGYIRSASAPSVRIQNLRRGDGRNGCDFMCNREDETC
ncbi:hypothetical protein ED733_008639 [Metarhizium rileyi]|uniref:Rhodopsin domain-containing protein n=1 Tax=Metarhizium rileyi (strain RCEF 4871) TaxID=1649241 RepID=A0A5C6GPX2_METRR|nr:hypothetical protein ED733_008639 [Metarhizium rileyi]